MVWWYHTKYLHAIMESEHTDLTDKLSDLIESLSFRENDPQFWEGLDEAWLKSRFEGASATEFHEIVPAWDLRPEALRFNDVLPDALVGAKLYMADRESFLRHCIDAELYGQKAYKNGPIDRQILKVAGQWLRGDTLTPPLFFLDSNGKLGKVDGHHRTTVALLAETPIFPFYCQQTLDLQGVVCTSLGHLIQSRWTTNGGR
jgi:hypothetical protein